MPSRAPAFSSVRCGPAILACLLCTTLAQAQESAAAMAGAGDQARIKDPVSGISNAKRDLELIKAANDPARRATNPAGASLPLPEVTVSGSAFEPARTPSAAPTQAQPVPRRGSNWLVDAMSKTPSAGRPGSDRELRPGRGERYDSALARGGEISDRDEAEDTAREPASGARRVERNSDGERTDSDRTNAAPAAPDANPLTRYLGDWMTPRDLALLRPTLEQGRPESAARGAPMGESVAGYDLTVFGVSSATDSNPTVSPLRAWPARRRTRSPGCRH